MYPNYAHFPAPHICSLPCCIPPKGKLENPLPSLHLFCLSNNPSFVLRCHPVNPVSSQFYSQVCFKASGLTKLSGIPWPPQGMVFLQVLSQDRFLPVLQQVMDGEVVRVGQPQAPDVAWVIAELVSPGHWGCLPQVRTEPALLHPCHQASSPTPMVRVWPSLLSVGGQLSLQCPDMTPCSSLDLHDIMTSGTSAGHLDRFGSGGKSTLRHEQGHRKQPRPIWPLVATLTSNFNTDTPSW